MYIDNWDRFVEYIKEKDFTDLRPKYDEIDDCFVENWLDDEEFDEDIFKSSWMSLDDDTQKKFTRAWAEDFADFNDEIEGVN